MQRLRPQIGHEWYLSNPPTPLSVKQTSILLELIKRYMTQEVDSPSQNNQPNRKKIPQGKKRFKSIHVTTPIAHAGSYRRSETGTME